MLGTITLTVGQPDGVSVAQKEEAPETMDAIQDEVAPQVNGEKVEKESADANDISVVEEKATEEKSEDANEVGFKKIFRFVGFKFTLKKDKSEEKDPVKLLTIKDKEDDTVVDEVVKEEEATVEEKSTVEEKEADTAVEAEVSKDAEKTESPEVEAKSTEGEVTEDAPKEEKTEKEEETSPAQEVISPFRKIFSGGLFSNLRKKASIKKTKDEEEMKEETPKEEETAAAGEEEKAETMEGALEEESKSEAKEEVAVTSEEDKPKEDAVTEDVKEVAAEESKPEAATDGEATAEAPTPETDTTDEAKPDEEKAALELSTEAELLSSQEKAKPHGSPLKKLFTGAGLKKLSTKKQKTKKDAETKLTESGEQAEQLQSSTESAEVPKAESGPSSPEESGEHVVTMEVTEKESSQETDGEVTSDGEKKKEGIIAWSSFKKLVTPKRRVKRPSESDDEGNGEKPAKSATLSSTESATLADKSGEEETKEEKTTEEEPKTEATEKLTSSTEEKKKMDTSVSWEALMCMGGPKKRTRKTSDSDDDETKVEEEPTAAVEEAEEEATVEAVVATPQTSENEGEVVSSPEPVSPPVSAWDTLKRMVTLKRTKSEEKPEDAVEQVLSDSEAPKEESSFFLKKFFPGRRKKKSEKQASTEHGSGEEDSDTPAVVPLSEYDEPAEPETEKQAHAEVVQAKVSAAEERSPSWISAAVEDDKQDQLSDIPEEAESAATPKSVDTDITEDEEQAPVSPKQVDTGRRLSIAEVKPVAPAPSSETATVPKEPETENAQEVLQAVEAQNDVIPAKTSVAVEDAPMETAVETTEYEPPTETADVKTNSILEVHARDEAMAICTGLGTKEIAKVTLEKPVSPITECMAVIRDACSTEVSIEEKPAITEQATMSEDPVLEAQIHQVDTTELEPMVEKTANSIADIQVATEGIEPHIEKVGIVSTEMEGSEVIQPPTVSENSPKVEVIDPIIATSEAALCTQSVEITEPTLETKEVQMDMEQLVATEEISPVEEVVHTVAKEVSSTIGDSTITTTKETEPEFPVVLPSEVIPVIAETVVLVAPASPNPEEVLAENVPVSEAVVDEVVESEVAGTEVIEETTEGETIESQSMEIAKNVIQEAVDKVSEDAPESEKPSSPSSTIPTPDHAVATIEKDVEIESETPIVTDTPIAILCEKSSPKVLHVAMEVTDTIPLEVTGSIDSTEEEKKPEEDKQEEEVKVSEETAAAEEKEEVKEESPDEPEPSNETAVAEENVNDTETVEEETESKPLELHIPVQVVLQTAQVLEEPTVEEEAAVEFDTNGPVGAPVQAEIKTNGEQVSERLSTVSEEPQEAEAAVAADSQPEAEKPLGKCAEVMAQVIEVIEEAVKEIEPVSTEITAAS
ncbi:A-kinase anchor protein 12b isoform X2 [Periophthalmus magnuspinnatus]|uniref:A-kinase anchor protein 12b isoform X2 n=1 Tax=Periophthalmus magnuspinnatus TaxID=409849 RepID=UPI00145B652A|nr:A-kinase anchor protein 12b isoform X2 [Periophthalmus magnuspinnatus]